MNQFPNKNYFTMPNEIFSLGLDASEIAVYMPISDVSKAAAPINAGRATPQSAMLLAAQRIRSCGMSMRSRRKVLSLLSRLLS